MAQEARKISKLASPVCGDGTSQHPNTIDQQRSIFIPATNSTTLLEKLGELMASKKAANVGGSIRKSGRLVGTRTPDLHRVKVS